MTIADAAGGLAVYGETAFGLPGDESEGFVPGITTNRLYERLPEFYRVADLTVPGDRPLLRFISLITDQVSDLEEVVDRLAAQMADPTLADDAWLDWLAQHVGVTLAPGLSVAERRNSVLYSASGWRAGTKDGIKDAARPALTDTQHVEVYDHTNDVSAIGAGGPWDVLLVTRGSETANPQEVLDTIVRQNAKPAGVRLYHRSFAATWDAVEAAYPTWNSIEAAGSWDLVQEAGL